MFFVQPHSSQIANRAPQSLPALNIVPKECWIDRLAVLVLCFIVLFPHRRISTWESIQQFPHGTHFYGSAFPLTKPFHYYLMFLIKFYVNRLDDSMCHGLFDAMFKLQASSLKFSSARRKANDVFWISSRSLLPSRSAIWSDKRPPSRDALCWSYPIQHSSRYFRAS